MLRIKHNNGQSSLEYTTVIIILIGALLAISVYFKRGVQGRWKDAIDGVGEQYDPRYTKSNSTQQMSSNTETQSWGDVIVNSTDPGKIHSFRIDTSSSVETTEGESKVSYY